MRIIMEFAIAMLLVLVISNGLRMCVGPPLSGPLSILAGIAVGLVLSTRHARQRYGQKNDRAAPFLSTGADEQENPMPTALGMMDGRDVARLHEWQQAMTEADYDEALREREAAIAGHDLYDRPLTDMTDSRCDYHTVTVFRLPLATVRRKRTLIGRLIGWLRL